MTTCTKTDKHFGSYKLRIRITWRTHKLSIASSKMPGGSSSWSDHHLRFLFFSFLVEPPFSSSSTCTESPFLSRNLNLKLNLRVSAFGSQRFFNFHNEMRGFWEEGLEQGFVVNKTGPVTLPHPLAKDSISNRYRSSLHLPRSLYPLALHQINLRFLFFAYININET